MDGFLSDSATESDVEDKSTTGNTIKPSLKALGKRKARTFEDDSATEISDLENDGKPLHKKIEPTVRMHL